MMIVMRLEEPDDFYEEDEDPAAVFARFDAGHKIQTGRPCMAVPTRQITKAENFRAITPPVGLYQRLHEGLLELSPRSGSNQQERKQA
jgi:hypothetical protein